MDVASDLFGSPRAPGQKFSGLTICVQRKIGVQVALLDKIRGQRCESQYQERCSAHKTSNPRVSTNAGAQAKRPKRNADGRLSSCRDIGVDHWLRKNQERWWLP